MPPIPKSPAPAYRSLRALSPLLISVCVGCAGAKPPPVAAAPPPATTAKQPPPPDPARVAREAENQRIREADRLVEEDRLERAKALLEELHAEAPKRTEILLRLGNTELALGNVEGALSAFETAYHLGVESPKLPESIAELWIRSGDLDEALPWLERAIEVAEDSTLLVLRKAQLLLMQEQLGPARAIAEGLVHDERRKISHAAHILLGYAAMQQHDEELAAKHWEAAAARGAAKRDVLTFLAQRHFEAGRYAEAARHYELSLDAGGDEHVHRRLVVALSRAAKQAAARDELLRYLEAHPESPHRDELLSLVEGGASAGR